jgi:hypothetical protein
MNLSSPFLAILAFLKKTQQERQKRMKVECFLFVIDLIVLWMGNLEEDQAILFRFFSSYQSGFLYYSSFFSWFAGQNRGFLSTCSSACFGSLSLGLFENGFSNHLGGGIWLRDNGLLLFIHIISCICRNCKKTKVISSNSILESTFSGCSGTTGGAIDCRGSTTLSLSISLCPFISCVATNGMTMEKTHIQCLIQNNLYDSCFSRSGGGELCVFYPVPKVIVRNCWFEECEASEAYGGGIACWLSSSSIGTLILYSLFSAEYWKIWTRC